MNNYKEIQYMNAKDLQFDAACLPQVATRTGGTVCDLGIVNAMRNRAPAGYASISNDRIGGASVHAIVSRFEVTDD